MGDEGATAISEALKYNSTLTKLFLHSKFMNGVADSMRAGKKKLMNR